MTATIGLPRVLASVANTETTHTVAGDTVAAALQSLFADQPGLRTHLLDETGAIRPHVLVFVDGEQAGLDTTVGVGADIRVLQAVSGG